VDAVGAAEDEVAAGAGEVLFDMAVEAVVEGDGFVGDEEAQGRLATGWRGAAVFRAAGARVGAFALSGVGRGGGGADFGPGAEAWVDEAAGGQGV
jgi:hypothetical protein